MLFLAALVTAALSATFGMAGGLLLMGIFVALLPVPEAMVLHGITQLVANGGRAWMLRTHVAWGGVGWYVLGALAAAAIVVSVAFVPDQRMVYLGIGAVPFLALLLPATRWMDFSHRPGALLAGLLVAGAQTLFGVAGPLLDVFFVHTRLEKRAVVATKAVTQTASHVLKIAVFLPHADLAAVAPAAGWTILGALVGTRLGGQLLEHLPEETFRRWTRALVLVIGGWYLWLGATAS